MCKRYTRGLLDPQVIMSAFAWESWASSTEGRVSGLGAQVNLIPEGHGGS